MGNEYLWYNPRTQGMCIEVDNWIEIDDWKRNLFHYESVDDFFETGWILIGEL